ncbi:CY561 protein, partial [Buphagus erythrorhynchus]|nr:CY561 protein [Buphagus erythrorhynchus]
AMDGAPLPPSPAGLSAYVAVSQLLGLTLLATTGAWLGRYRGGVAWHSPLQFNAHPLCMVLAMVFLQGDALLVYRVFRHEAKRSTKALHALLHGLALVIALVGECWDGMGWDGMGWDGMGWDGGYGALQEPLLSSREGTGLPIAPVQDCATSFICCHQVSLPKANKTPALLSCSDLGKGVFPMVCLSIPLHPRSDSYSHFVPEGILANTLGVLLVAFGLVVGYVLTREEWRRSPLAEELPLSMDFKTLTEGESPGGGS